MYCIRCGREQKDEKHVFCPSCREIMAACPVPPGTPIQLPSRGDASPSKKKAVRKKKELKPEELVIRLRISNRWLAFALIVTVLAFAATALVLLHTLDEPEAPIDQNYSTVAQTDGK